MDRPRKYGLFVKFVALVYLLYLCLTKDYLNDVIDTWYMKYSEPNLKKYQMGFDD